VLKRFEASGLELRLYGEAGTRLGRRRRSEPAWGPIQRELKKKKVALKIVPDVYIATHLDGSRYSRFNVQ